MVELRSAILVFVFYIAHIFLLCSSFAVFCCVKQVIFSVHLTAVDFFTISLCHFFSGGIISIFILITHYFKLRLINYSKLQKLVPVYLHLLPLSSYNFYIYCIYTCCKLNKYSDIIITLYNFMSFRKRSGKIYLHRFLLFYIVLKYS